MGNSILPLAFDSVRTRIMRSLLIAGKPVSLREMAYRSRTGLRSMQIGLDQLCRESVIAKRRSGNRVLFRVNLPCDQTEIVMDVITKMTIMGLKGRSVGYHKKAREVVRFLVHSGKLIRTPRARYHGTD